MIKWRVNKILPTLWGPDSEKLTLLRSIELVCDILQKDYAANRRLRQLPEAHDKLLPTLTEWTSGNDDDEPFLSRHGVPRAAAL